MINERAKIKLDGLKDEVQNGMSVEGIFAAPIRIDVRAILGAVTRVAGGKWKR